MERNNRWRWERRVSVSVWVQLLTLAGFIVGSWVNLQRQLDLVSHDVKQLLTIAEKPDLVNTITIKVWTQTGTSSSLGSANLVFCINLQENRLGKEKS